jgi:hypothetical protein
LYRFTPYLGEADPETGATAKERSRSPTGMILEKWIILSKKTTDQ